MRIDSDLLGEMEIPDDVYYGAQTLRTIELFEPSKELINQFPEFINAVAAIKKSCALVHGDLKLIDPEIVDAIAAACDEVRDGIFNNDLILDMLSGNDFSPINMNFNEVIACRANEIITGEKGYTAVQPNTHVNMGQSTCDSAYSAARFGLYSEIEKVKKSVQKLSDAYHSQAEKYKDSVKVSHTCFQDAAPITMGQFFGAAVSFLNRQLNHLDGIQSELKTHAIGYTVIGTGLGSFSGFHERINDVLSRELGYEVTFGDDPVDQLQYADVFLRAQNALKSVITGVSKMARDIRIMSSGPDAGFSEIQIEAVQNGSSFFPGKINPSLAELVNIACYQVCGYSTSITMAVEAGELDVTPWYPVFTVNTLNSAKIIYKAINAFSDKCISTLTVNVESNYKKAVQSMGMAVAVSAVLGYKTATKVALYAGENNLTIKEAVIKMGLMSEEQANLVIDPLLLTNVDESSQLLLDGALNAKKRY
ncbi:lyase family protein [Pseudemcibacter aquimaris]|uniref:lyase family protein n=1 Tax=Pseudemcibacter aquimaris TaxID=2857064 RepID=UPI0020128A60|nr:lyase family protein [Pseudemcibacter aquimaris]MCC3861655.1 hypothetical protein [Pseudemcibacter aquimaris]WDU58426.1 hypothetical protein KW060_14630 [Pseudemcibacter aquimaris]